MSWQENLGIDEDEEYDVYSGQITYRFRDGSTGEGDVIAEIEQESYAPVPKEGDRIAVEATKADFDDGSGQWQITGEDLFGAMVVTSVNYQYTYLFFDDQHGEKGQRLLTTVEIWGEPIQNSES